MQEENKVSNTPGSVEYRRSFSGGSATERRSVVQADVRHSPLAIYLPRALFLNTVCGQALALEGKEITVCMWSETERSRDRQTSVVQQTGLARLFGISVL